MDVIPLSMGLETAGPEARTLTTSSWTFDDIEGRLGWCECNTGSCVRDSTRVDGYGCVQLGVIVH